MVLSTTYTLMPPKIINLHSEHPSWISYAFDPTTYWTSQLGCLTAISSWTCSMLHFWLSPQTSSTYSLYPINWWHLWTSSGSGQKPLSYPWLLASVKPTCNLLGKLPGPSSKYAQCLTTHSPHCSFPGGATLSSDLHSCDNILTALPAATFGPQGSILNLVAKLNLLEVDVKLYHSSVQNLPMAFHFLQRRVKASGSYSIQSKKQSSDQGLQGNAWIGSSFYFSGFISFSTPSCHSASSHTLLWTQKHTPCAPWAQQGTLPSYGLA